MAILWLFCFIVVFPPALGRLLQCHRHICPIMCQLEFEFQRVIVNDSAVYNVITIETLCLRDRKHYHSIVWKSKTFRTTYRSCTRSDVYALEYTHTCTSVHCTNYITLILLHTKVPSNSVRINTLIGCLFEPGETIWSRTLNSGNRNSVGRVQTILCTGGDITHFPPKWLHFTCCTTWRHFGRLTQVWTLISFLQRVGQIRKMLTTKEQVGIVLKRLSTKKLY